jgi:hypothetical protein
MEKKLRNPAPDLAVSEFHVLLDLWVVLNPCAMTPKKPLAKSMHTRGALELSNSP